MKIITAIGNPYINENLRNIKGCEIIGTDIQYQEGIIEVLEEKKDIDIVILSNRLPKEYDFNILINKIKIIKEDIEIIVFLDEKNEKIEMFLNSKKIYKIYYLDNYDAFFYNFKSNFESINQDVAKEIGEFKNVILNNNGKKLRIKTANTFNCINKNNLRYNTESKVIVVNGNYGVGKSIVSSILSNVISMENKKVLLIDFDIFNSSINTIFGVKKYPKNIDKQDLASFIININKNLDVICGLDYIFIENADIREYELKEKISKLKDKYELIIIDTSANIDYKFTKTIVSIGDKVLFLIEPNLLEIKKANKILEIYLKDWSIDKSKVKIVFNKVNKYGIAECVLEELFSELQIIGNIEYDERYNLIINKNMCKNFNKINYEKIYGNLLN